MDHVFSLPVVPAGHHRNLPLPTSDFRRCAVSNTTTDHSTKPNNEWDRTQRKLLTMNTHASQCVRRLISSGGVRPCTRPSFRKGGRVPLGSHLHTYADRLWLQERREENETKRLRALPSVSAIPMSHYHTSARTERASVIMLGLGALSAASYSASYAVRAYKEWQATPPEEPPVDETKS